MHMYHTVILFEDVPYINSTLNYICGGVWCGVFARYKVVKNLDEINGVKK